MDDSNSSPVRATDPARFGRMVEPSYASQRSTAEVVGSSIALLALVVGLPVALFVLSGPPPIPTSVPSLRDLAQQLSVEDLLTVLVAVVWLTWAYFLVCVVVEVIAARRGGLARPVPLAGPLQRLAQVLVGALLLSGLLAAPAQASMVAEAANAPTGPVASAAVTGGPSAAVTSSAAAQSTQTDTADESDSLTGKRVYDVKAPKEGYHDNLWDIAERHLGDGRRYKEIYELNKDREQLDGRQLDLARLIQPGWGLVMPDDATGVARVSAPAAPAAPAAPGEAAQSEASGEVAQSGAPGAATVGAASTQDDAAWMAGGGLLAAGLLGALALQRRRGIGRRPDGDALEGEGELRFTATTTRSSWLDRALRDLAMDCRGQSMTPPPVYAVIVNDDSIDLLLAPAVLDAVDGWSVEDDGRRWHHGRDHDEPATASTEVAPYPALASLGVDADGRDVLVDLEAAGGIVSIAGDGSVATEVAAAIAVQCATSPWAEAVRVSASDLPAGIADIGDERIRIVDDLDAAAAEYEEQLDRLRVDVLTGRMGRRAFVPTHLLVCGSEPGSDLAARLGGLVGNGRQALSIVVAGDHKAARWRLHVDEFGVLSIPQLNLTVTANRISTAEVDAVAELFAASREPERTDAGTRTPIPQPRYAHDDAAWTTGARRVGVLGKVSVSGVGDLPAERANLTTELIVFLAMHRDSVHPHVLAGALWPRGVSTDVLEAAVERGRAWLGSDTDGSHFLLEDADGRLSLSDAVVCDWDCVRTLLLQSRATQSPRDEIDLLRRALKMMRATPFEGVPEKRYGWVAHDDAIRTMILVAVDAAQRLAELLGTAGDPDGAGEAAQAGLRMCPSSQSLWRQLIRSRYASAGVAGVQHTLDQMSGQLTGVALDSETEALIEEFLPDTHSPATGNAAG